MRNIDQAHKMAARLSAGHDLKPVSYYGLMEILEAYHDSGGLLPKDVSDAIEKDVMGDDQHGGKTWLPKADDWVMAQDSSGDLCLIWLKRRNGDMWLLKNTFGFWPAILIKRLATAAEMFRPGAKVHVIVHGGDRCGMEATAYVKCCDIDQAIPWVHFKTHYLNAVPPGNCTLLERAPE